MANPVGEIYGKVKPILYPQSLPDRGIQARDISIIKRLLKGYTGEEIVLMCQRMRAKVDADELPEWAAPKGNFRMMLVLACNPALLLAESIKDQPAPKTPDASTKPVSMASLLGDYLT